VGILSNFASTNSLLGIDYIGGGQYEGRITVLVQGPFIVKLQLGGVETARSRGLASCRDGRVPLSDNSCGCKSGFKPAQNDVDAQCRSCAVGSYKDSPGDRPCSPCPVGYSQPHEGSVACFACGEGEYQPEVGAATCRVCKAATSSLSGSDQCRICAPSYRRPNADSSVTQCESCDNIPGALCGANTTIASLILRPGYWRLSTLTTKTYRCDTLGNQTCVGGTEGNSICKDGHAGPLCKVCVGETQKYYDNGSCKDCPEAGRGVLPILAVLAATVLVVAALFWLHEQRAPKYDRYAVPWRRCVHHVKAFVKVVGLVPKAKVAITFMQVIAALDSTFAIGLPDQWFGWTRSLRFLGDLKWEQWVAPSVCIFGSDVADLLLLRALGPLAVIVLVPFLGSVASALRWWCKASSKRHAKRARSRADHQFRSLTEALAQGCIDGFPLALVLTFCFTPPVSASIFRVWQCVSYSYDDAQDEKHSYLAEDLSIRCDGSPEHSNIINVAWPLVCVWPIGMVIMYAALLIPCRTMLIDETASTPLLRATEFLHRD